MIKNVCDIAWFEIYQSMKEIHRYLLWELKCMSACLNQHCLLCLTNSVGLIQDLIMYKLEYLLLDKSFQSLAFEVGNLENTADMSKLCNFQLF